MKEPRLIAVVTTGTRDEAAAARNILESRGIRVFVDPPGDMRPVPPGGVFRVLVLAEDREAAEEALASPASDALECRQGEADGGQSSPAAAEAIRATPDDCAVRAYRAAPIPKDGITDEDWQAPPDLTDELLPEEKLLPADDYARMAAIAGVVWPVFPPLLLAVPYCLVRAALAARKQPPRDAARYRKNTARASVFGILLPWGLTAWWILSLSVEWAGW